MKNYLLNFNKSIKESLFQLEKNNEKCLLIVDSNNVLKGTLTDGDIRRAILNGANSTSRISKYVKKNPAYLKYKEISKDELNFKKNKKIQNLIKKIKDDNIDIIPVLDEFFKVKKILYKKDFKKFFERKELIKKIPVVIMAGGRGERLKEFTNYFPKPLVPVENSTAIEYIINLFKSFGVSKFFVTLNYKKNLIKSYLKENKLKNINFIEEKSYLGTAGSISMLKEKINSDFFIINCDTILKINLTKFYEYHKKNNYDLTIVTAMKNYAFPYGSCEIKKNMQLKKIIEKPSFSSLANVGLYLCKPKIIKLIKKNVPYGMDQLIKKINKTKGKVGVFPIGEENWIDTGSYQNK